ncbi:MAG: ATP12 family protein [Alphaproteobacteria bacterium]|nr:ATP12 family protein [Alphaproteobacteria bacterium]
MMSAKKQVSYSVRPEGDLFAVYRDEAVLETPRNLPVAVASRKLAEVLAEECRSQGDRLDLRKMPMMQMTLTTLDITVAKRDEIEDGIMRFGENELVCLRAEEPAELAAAQETAWRPYLDWAAERFGAVLRTGAGITPPQQDVAELGKLREYVVSCDAYRLTGLSEAVGISGSLVLGLALATGHANAHEIVRASEHDQIWQMKKWGEDPAVIGRNADIERELAHCEHWLALTA